jgi:hypothetical protein
MPNMSLHYQPIKRKPLQGISLDPESPSSDTRSRLAPYALKSLKPQPVDQPAKAPDKETKIPNHRFPRRFIGNVPLLIVGGYVLGILLLRKFYIAGC